MLHNLSVPLFAKGQSKAKEIDKAPPESYYKSLNVTYFIIEISDWCEHTGKDNDVQHLRMFYN